MGGEACRTTVRLRGLRPGRVGQVLPRSAAEVAATLRQQGRCVTITDLYAEIQSFRAPTPDEAAQWIRESRDAR